VELAVILPSGKVSGGGRRIGVNLWVSAFRWGRNCDWAPNQEKRAPNRVFPPEQCRYNVRGRRKPEKKSFAGSASEKGSP